MSLDVINGMFEMGMATAIAMSIIRISKDRKVYGLHWSQVAFPTAWGLFNLLYYPSLDQWFSFAGGVAVVVCNTVYLALIWRYHKNT